MTFHTCIKKTAKECGLTMVEVARQLGLYPSNLSAMDSGSRAVSLRTLNRIAQLLDCGLGDLLEVTESPNVPVFRQRDLDRRLKTRDLGIADGTERGWVHTTLLAWQRHYKASRSVR